MQFEKWSTHSLKGELPEADRLVQVLERQDEELEELYRSADAIRSEYAGDEIHIRGIIEFSNHCNQNCLYCGIRSANTELDRYRMEKSEILQVARRAVGFGYGTVVLQSGEPAPYTVGDICEIVEKIKEKTALAVTLSLGVYPLKDYERFRAAGADRYLLRFETSDRELFSRLHPDISFDRRLQAVEEISSAGLQSGSGFMIGLPGAGLAAIARDIIFTSSLDLDMIGCGPYIAAAGTALAGEEYLLADREIYFKVMALLRILNPRAHIPATTAFDSLFGNGRDLVLKRGGNVFMPNLTPARYRQRYQLYTGKPCIDEHADQCAGCVQSRLQRLSRPPAQGPGHSLKI